ncbi:bacillithiol system redox-active protein YtxJ [Risungbinella massiliensis]|uniref:bacillithiol system redox-active protein YtxJ n=1 Tax=Risungbinella massiliensis TaxID=1329796 RepID=UPI0005CBB517|nr:bacillithiol system redox-active protein YtxJ [Risungbinella massiliensis]
MQSISTREQLAKVYEHSQQEKVVLLKHSTTCPISTAALDEVKKFAKTNPTCPVYVVYVIESRPISLQIAEDLAVRHESPQVIVLENKKASWSASHWKITEKSLAEQLV